MVTEGRREKETKRKRDEETKRRRDEETKGRGDGKLTVSEGKYKILNLKIWLRKNFHLIMQ